MKRWLFCIGLLFAVSGCGGSEDPVTPSVSTSACGAAPASAPAAECIGLSQCGAGAQNFSKDPTCDNCPHRADSHLCEAGTCRAMESLELVSVLISVGPEGTGATGFTIATINPVMADGSKVTCATLLSSQCSVLENSGLNITNSTHKRFSGGGASPQMVYQTGISAEPGADRILFVQATEEQSGDGKIMAHGCVDAITVPLPAAQNRIGIELVAP